MSAPLKFVGAIVTAVAITALSGTVSNAVISPEKLEKNAVHIEVPVIQVAAETSAPAAQATTAKAAVKTAAAAAPELSVAELLATADAEKGKKLSKACTACHSFDKGGKNKIGPNLWNIVDREKGTVEGFKYSKGLMEKGGTWDIESMDAFLKKPKKYIRGTKMTYAGMKKPQDRADMIAYLKTLTD